MMNRVVLVGRLTKDPEVKYTQNGIAVANFTLACNRPFTSQDGKQEADFIQVQVWRKTAENVGNYLKKGSLAGVDGRIQTRNYENQEGKRVYVTEVIADTVQFLGTRGSQQGQQQGQNRNQQGQGGQYPNNQNQRGFNPNDPFANTGQIDISDDDLPF